MSDFSTPIVSSPMPDVGSAALPMPMGQLIKNTLVVALAGLLFGYDTGVISGSQMYFTEYFRFTPAEQGWAVGSALYGCLVGALAAGFCTKQWGRKLTLLASALLFVISAYGSGAADSLTALALFRWVGGLGVGMASMAAPMYIAEISPAHLRGRMVSLYQLAVVIGFFVVFLASYFIGGGQTADLSVQQLETLHRYNIDSGWRWMLWSELPIAAAFFLLLFSVPESPRWLVMAGRRTAAKDGLHKLCGNEVLAARELLAIEADVAKSVALSWRQLFSLCWHKGPLRYALIVGVLLSIFQQVTGINAILYYGAEIFSNALGYGAEDALKQQLWLGGVNLIFTFVAIFTVDRLGRKPLLMLGALGMMLGLLLLAATLMAERVGVMSLVGVLTFIGAFAVSMGPVVWVMLSEIFPNAVRAQCLSIAVAAQWLFNAFVAHSFPLINEHAVNSTVFSGALPYLLFAFFCLLSLLFVWRWVPETKGRSLEQMATLWLPKP
ncbi:sugar porter family MFS transporter [Simiduia curdlanivorans]|uniref:Sugar porter family MFS transporter n=1 Tax=Simiduia curdlanivorans TaxID=1492769 RepID=A0ABV8V780_9GAMM|nr:sugar porter family MFS transporter [Simiduia curdlanivorans]MDN3640721.1 sugar porter family MFS transporter [Simiduia curdlanivorans]